MNKLRLFLFYQMLALMMFAGVMIEHGHRGISIAALVSSLATFIAILFCDIHSDG